MIRRMFAILFIILSVFLLFSCENGATVTPRSRVFYDYFDTVGTFYDYSGLSEEKFNDIANRVELSLSDYHKLFDIYNEYDGIVNLATINRTAGGGAQKVDKKIVDLLLYCKEMYNLTGGEVNVAMGAVLEIWHEYRTAGTEIPPMSVLSDAKNHTDISALVIDEENLTVELLDPDMSIDVGAVAKGYAVEMTAQMLEDAGYAGCVLDVGGNLRAIGAKPDGSGWMAGIRNPLSPYSQTYIYKIEIKDSSLVTSGVYERYYTVGGVRYHHIIDGESLMPENRYLSVSVKADSSAMSDARSTAIFNMTPDEAREFVESQRGIFVVLVMPNGKTVTLGE